QRPAPYRAPARQHPRPAPCLAPWACVIGPSALPRPPGPLFGPAAPRPLGPTLEPCARPPVWPLGPASRPRVIGPSAPP
ncbi:unnamed protein product, partial [Closterium sp. NIES-54]